jgi:hypothetical protein
MNGKERGVIMFKKLHKSQLDKIATRVIALERKKMRLLDILFEQDENMAIRVFDKLNDEEQYKRR